MLTEVYYDYSACFAGTRIVLRQVSPESESIYDFIIHLHKAYKGDWKKVQRKKAVMKTTRKIKL